MSVKRETAGTGITERELMVLSGPLSVTEFEELKQWIGKVRHQSFAEDLCHLSNEAAAILQDHGIPSVPGVYLQIGGGAWKRFADRKSCAMGIKEARATGATYRFSENLFGVANMLGHAHDTPAGYAARALDLVLEIGQARARGDFDGHGRAVMTLGQMMSVARFKVAFEKDTLRGRKTGPSTGREGGLASAKLRKHVSSEQRARMLAEFKRLKARMSTMDAYRRLSKEHGFSVKTIQIQLKKALAS
jgi:hypothetical protein